MKRSQKLKNSEINTLTFGPSLFTGSFCLMVFDGVTRLKKKKKLKSNKEQFSKYYEDINSRLFKSQITVLIIVVKCIFFKLV